MPAGKTVLHGELQPGSFPVGVRKETLPVRITGGGEQPTPGSLDLYMWYPAADAGAATEPLRYRDYYRIQEAEAPGQETLREWLAADMTNPPALTEVMLDDVLEASMWARRDPAPAPGRHPLVLWTYRDSIPTMQTALSEYLASHGYVVVFAWPAEHAPPFAWQEGLAPEAKARALESQVEMLSAALDSVAARSLVDAERVALLSWSYGGESAHHLARRRSDIRLNIGLDSILAGNWIYVPDDSPSLEDVSSPYVLIKHGRPRMNVDPAPPPPLLDQLPVESWYVRLKPLMHGNFNFPGGDDPGGAPASRGFSLGGGRRAGPPGP